MIATTFLSYSLSLGVMWISSDMRQSYVDEIDSPYYAALNSQTPEDYVVHVQQMVQGIENLGLDEHDMTTMVPWERYEYFTVGTMIDYYNSLLNRGEDMVTWKNDLYTNKTVSEVTDLYTVKIDNLHDILDDFRGYSTIKTAYQIKYAVHYRYGIWSIWAVAITSIVLVCYLYYKYNDYIDHINSNGGREGCPFWHHPHVPDPIPDNVWLS